jgi:hypothetical protein
VLRGLAPPFRSELLDDVAAILGRRVSDNPGGRELDVDRTLRRTLEAGLAPQLVLRAHASTLPILVLEDVGDEMRPFRRRVAALLAGLEARGVHLDRWRFDADADRLFHFEDGAALALRQLLRRRAESPLLVISTGQGIWEGAEGRVAAWVPALRSWRQRTWLHPGTDSRAWRPALAQVPLDVWPMTRPGLLAAARHIARGDSRLLGLREARSPAERAVTPLDVDRLRWLLDLAPRRDPELGELLRQRFCPEVPEAALQEALEAPPLSTRPPLGLADAAVHAFLLGVLDDSRPDQGSAGHERWRLDRALQALGTRGKDEESAEAELAELAASPLAPEVERALKRRARTLPGKAAERLHARVLHPLNRRAREAGLAAGEEGGGGRRWTWPTPGELAAALVGAAVLWLALPFFGAFARDTVPLKPAPPPPRPPASVPSKQASPLIKENGTTPLSARRRERARAVKRTDSPRPVRSKTSTPPSLQVDPPTATTQIPLQAVASLPVPGQAQNPAPQQQPYEPSSGSIVERTGETVHVHLDCGEETSQELTYPLQAGEEFVSATIEIVKNSDMGMTAGKPVYDPEARKVSTTVPLRGPKRADCQIGGDLDFRLRVTVRFYPV